MTIDVIDTTLHTSSFPTTYIGKGTLIGNPYVAAGVVERLSGYFTSDGNAVQIALGFKPTRIKLVNVTDGIVWEWQYGMPVANSIKLTLGTVAAVQDTSSQLATTGGEASNSPGIYTLTIGATAAGSAKNISYQIEG